MPAPRFDGLKPSSGLASRIKQRLARRDTKPEVLLRRALTALGVRYRLHAKSLPGCPDLVIPGARIAVFCDGDFWHGRQWRQRRRKLQTGSNASYWIQKIRANVRRDRRNTRALCHMGWRVIRVWESDILENADRQARLIVDRMSKADARLANGR